MPTTRIRVRTTEEQRLFEQREKGVRKDNFGCFGLLAIVFSLPIGVVIWLLLPVLAGPELPKGAGLVATLLLASLIAATVIYCAPANQQQRRFRSGLRRDSKDDSVEVTALKVVDAIRLGTSGHEPNAYLLKTLDGGVVLLDLMNNATYIPASLRTALFDYSEGDSQGVISSRPAFPTERIEFVRTRYSGLLLKINCRGASVSPSRSYYSALRYNERAQPMLQGLETKVQWYGWDVNACWEELPAALDGLA